MCLGHAHCILESLGKHEYLSQKCNTAKIFPKFNKFTHRHGYSFDAEPEKEIRWMIQRQQNVTINIKVWMRSWFLDLISLNFLTLFIKHNIHFIFTGWFYFIGWRKAHIQKKERAVCVCVETWTLWQADKIHQNIFQSIQQYNIEHAFLYSVACDVTLK